MKATPSRRLILPLALVLLFSAVVSCDMMEVANAYFCTDAPPAQVADQPATDERAVDAAACDAARVVPVDCCGGCMTCCASYTEAPALAPLALTGASMLPGFSVVQAPPGSPLSIWRPPRV